MSQLPIETVMPSLIDKLISNSQLILKASTGAGKSTLLPLMLLKQKVINGKIIMLEPRRLAARNIAAYLASQLGEKVGDTIGLRIRGETRVSDRTLFEVVTEGVMTKMIQSDPELSNIGLLIFDEFHERSIHADTALAFALEVQEALRDDLKLLVMSATLDKLVLQQLLPNAEYIESEGRMFPVATHYAPLKPNQRIIDATEHAIRDVLINHTGSILVFLSGVGEIKQLEQRLRSLTSDIIVSPLFGQLDTKKQQQALLPAPKGQRKIVLATNVAETSLTIEGIRIVIDTGYEQQATFDIKTAITKLERKRITQSSAEQRKGRAGRLESGICIRLYSESQFQQQAYTQTPEIESSDLTSLVLELVKWGVANPQDLQWLSPPPNANIQQAKSLLLQLGLIDKQGQLTELGEASQQFSIEPRLAVILLQAKSQSTAHLQTALHLLPIIEDAAKSVCSKDLSVHLSLLLEGKYPKQNNYQQRIEQLAAILSTKANSKQVMLQLVGEVLVAGFPDRLAAAKGNLGQFQLANGHGAQIDEIEQLAQNDYLVVVDLLKGSQSRSYIFLAAPLSKLSLMTVAAHLITEEEYLDWDDKLARIIAEKRSYLGRIILQKKQISLPDFDKVSLALLSMLKRKGLTCLNWNEEVQALHSRLMYCQRWLPEIPLPPMDEKQLLENVELWLLPFMHHIQNDKQLKSINIIQALEAYVGWDKIKQINELLPTQYVLATGTRAKISYELQSDPKISVKIQEVYGEEQTPLVAQGRKKLVMELLSPAGRPLQITNDLASFWRGSYKEVQKEMKGRYPKHIWPDDPATHLATKKTKRHFN